MDGIRAMPPHASYADFSKVAQAVEAAVGSDYGIGPGLPGLMAAAGLATVHVEIDQPVYRAGPGKHLWEQTWTVAAPNARARRGADGGGGDPHRHPGAYRAARRVDRGGADVRLRGPQARVTVSPPGTPPPSR